MTQGFYKVEEHLNEKEVMLPIVRVLSVPPSEEIIMENMQEFVQAINGENTVLYNIPENKWMQKNPEDNNYYVLYNDNIKQDKDNMFG